jgi:Flp pilus assembly pilin Flp
MVYCPCPIEVTGVPVRQLIRRFRTCEAGAGTVEYALLIAVLAIGLAGVLTIFRNAVGGLTNRTAVGVSTQASGGYGKSQGGPSGGIIAHRPAAADPDSSSAEPDSSSASGGTTAATFDPGAP